MQIAIPCIRETTIYLGCVCVCVCVRERERERESERDRERSRALHCERSFGLIVCFFLIDAER